MKLIVRYRFALLAVSAAFSLAVLALMPPGEFDTNLENMLPASDPVRQTYEQLIGSFSSDEVVIAGYVDPELFDPSGVGIERLEELSDRLAAVPGVRATISLADIDAALSRLDLLGRFTSAQPHAVLRDTKLAANALELAEQITHGKDRQSAAIVCLLEADSMASENTMEALTELLRIMDNLPPGMSKGVVAGEATIVYEGSRLLEEDGWRLLTMAIALMTGVLAVCFRSLFWALAPLVVVALCTAMTQCAVSIAGGEATVITSMLSSVVAVISIAAAVHVIARMRAKLASGLPMQSALPAALSETIRPIVWAAITDCVAFAALIGSDVTVVSDFGAAMSIGALLVPPSILLVIPGLAGIAGPVESSNEQGGWAATSLASVADAICRRPRVTAAVSLGVALAASLGVATLKINTDFIATFDENTRIVQSYEFAESRLGGAGSWDVLIPAPEHLSGEFIERVDLLEQRLRELQIDGEPVVTKVISVVDFLSIAGEWTPIATRAKLLNWAPNGLQASFLGNAEGQSWLRMMLRSSERQSVAAKQQAIALVEREVERTFPAVDNSPAGR